MKNTILLIAALTVISSVSNAACKFADVAKKAQLDLSQSLNYPVKLRFSPENGYPMSMPILNSGNYVVMTGDTKTAYEKIKIDLDTCSYENVSGKMIWASVDADGNF